MASSSLTAVPERRDAKLLQVLGRQARKDRLVYLVLAECRLVLPEAQAPQPDHNVHEGAQTQGCPHIIVPPRERVQEGLQVCEEALGLPEVHSARSESKARLDCRGAQVRPGNSPTVFFRKGVRARHSVCEDCRGAE